MTYADAMTHAQAGKRLTHPGLNRGWSVVWRDKQPMYLNGNDPTAKPLACKVDDRELTRGDWEIVI